MSDRDERLRDVLAVYGADPRRWPAADRAALADRLDPGGTEYRDAALLDSLLASASPLVVSDSSHHRLMQEVRGMQLAARHPVLRWSAALPLAASLLLGIYLGTQDAADPWFSVEETLAAGDDDADLSGVGEAESYAEENVS